MPASNERPNFADWLHAAPRGRPLDAVKDGGPTDSELLGRMAGPWNTAAREALAALYGRHASAVRRFLGRFNGVRDPQIEDWMQETFLTARRHAGAFRCGSALPWLLAIAAREVRDARRADRRRIRRERLVAEERLRTAPSSDGFDSLVAGLPERLRVVLELRFVSGLEHARVAEVLGVSLRTAKSWTAEAVALLRSRHRASGESREERT